MLVFCEVCCSFSNVCQYELPYRSHQKDLSPIKYWELVWIPKNIDECSSPQILMSEHSLNGCKILFSGSSLKQSSAVWMLNMSADNSFKTTPWNYPMKGMCSPADVFLKAFQFTSAEAGRLHKTHLFSLKKIKNKYSCYLNVQKSSSKLWWKNFNSNKTCRFLKRMFATSSPIVQLT